MLRRLGLVAVLAALATTLVTPAVAGAAGIDHKRLAKRVAASVGAAYPDLPVTKAKCPKAIARKVGTTALCTVTAGGLSLQMRITVTDRAGDVTIESTQAIIPKAAAEAFVQANATLPALVDCGPDPYIVRIPGAPFRCTATFADGTVQQVTLSPTDVDGNVTITLVD